MLFLKGEDVVTKFKVNAGKPVNVWGLNKTLCENYSYFVLNIKKGIHTILNVNTFFFCVNVYNFSYVLLWYFYYDLFVIIMVSLLKVIQTYLIYNIIVVINNKNNNKNFNCFSNL